jgi:hypothetical protein
MKPGDAALLLGLGRSTVTTWTAGEWREYFTPGAQGGEGKVRNLTDIDVRILAFIDAEKRRGAAGDEIHAALKRLRANDWIDLPPLPMSDGTAGMRSVPVVPQAAAEAGLQAERRSLLHEIANLQKRLENVEDQLRQEQSARREDVERLLREAAEERGKLLEELAELRSLVKLYESGRLKPAKDE